MNANSNSLDQWFYDSTSFVDSISVEVSLVLGDSFTFEEDINIARHLNRGLPDSLSFSDTLVTAFNYGRNFTDSYSFTDVPTFNVSKALADSITLNDSYADVIRDFTTLADQPTLSEQHALIAPNIKRSIEVHTSIRLVHVMRVCVTHWNC